MYKDKEMGNAWTSLKAYILSVGFFDRERNKKENIIFLLREVNALLLWKASQSST